MRLISLVTLCLGLALTGCGDGGTTAKLDGGDGGGEPIRIGIAGPITGGQAKNGEDLVNGTTLAAEEWNAKGGVLGRQLEVVSRDDEALDKNATVVAGELVAEGVAGVVGHFNSGCTIPASEQYHDAGVPVITPASTNTFVTDRGYPDVFRVCGRDDQQGIVAASFVAEVLKVNKVAVFDDRTAYGKGLADEFAKGLGDRVEVAVREGFDATERNFRPYLAKLKEAGVDLWYFGGIYDQAAPMLIQARQLGITAPMMSGDGVHNYPVEFLAKVGDGANGTLTTFPNTAAAPGYNAFVEKYKTRFEKDPGPYAIYSYVAANILIEGISQAGTTDGADVATVLHEKTFDTPLGDVAFDDKGDVKVNPYTVWIVKDGKHVVHDSNK